MDFLSYNTKGLKKIPKQVDTIGVVRMLQGVLRKI